MPLYEYRCPKCDHTLEKIQGISDKAPPCPKCEGETARQIGLSSFRLKGQGWGDQGYQKKEGK